MSRAAIYCKLASFAPGAGVLLLAHAVSNAKHSGFTCDDGNSD